MFIRVLCYTDANPSSLAGFDTIDEHKTSINVNHISYVEYYEDPHATGSVKDLGGCAIHLDCTTKVFVVPYTLDKIMSAINELL